ncbi:non-specific lipid-transfer protein 8-like [Asparagus officinalis]|uniref:non-specific lipid-transfer protein 8-like n=1 Tax=Asparagus officinalis TaxID=4686 RepID=UPI00098DFED2|nr:non-specific lipid-transfer protein 8-like [Asparagus officinalis]
MKQYFAILVLFLLSLQLFQNSEADLQCSDVLKDLIPCVSYLTSNSGSPSTTCCNGVTTLASAASTTADRRAACSCIMNVVSKVKPNVEAAKALPGSCNTTLPFTVSPNMDCSKID